MKWKKILVGFLVATVVTSSSITAFAVNTNEVKNINEVMPINEESDQVEQSYFMCFTGEVKEINDFGEIEGSKIVSVESEEEQPANIIISEDTYVNGEVEIGSVITGYYEADAPMIMIYPPQYNAQVVIVESDDKSVKVDIFDKDLVSSDNFLKLNIFDSTEIVSQDGSAFEGELAGRKLVVTYDITTRSIPAQTNPIKIVVLFEKEVPGDDVIGDISSMDIIVDNQKIEGPAAYTNEQNVVMVPLRAISEALGFNVSWNNELRSVAIGKTMTLKIGEDNYIFAKMAQIKLGTAPVIIEGRTFVPLNFFREVAQMNNAYVFEGQIVINNGEKME